MHRHYSQWNRVLLSVGYTVAKSSQVAGNLFTRGKDKESVTGLYYWKKQKQKQKNCTCKTQLKLDSWCVCAHTL